MAGNLLEVINSRSAAGIGLVVTRILPNRLGYGLAQFLVDRFIGRRSQPAVQAIRINQWIAHDQKPSAQQLDLIVRSTFRNRACAIFDLFRHLRNERAMREMIDFGPDFENMVERNQRRKEGTVVMLTHTGAHEFIAIAAALRGMKGMALSYPRQSGGYEWHDELRERYGFNAVPTTMATLKLATQYLKDGGTVFTGLDRPLPDSHYRPIFFGRPTSLPVHYISMALIARVPVVAFAIRRKADGKYLIVRSDFIEMEHRQDRREGIIINAERILNQAEGFIREAPDQWAMFYPLWPELQDIVP